MGKDLTTEEKAVNTMLRHEVNQRKKKYDQTRHEYGRLLQWHNAQMEVVNPSDNAFHKWQRDMKQTEVTMCQKEFDLLEKEEAVLDAKEEEIKAKNYGYIKDVKRSERHVDKNLSIIANRKADIIKERSSKNCGSKGIIQ